MGSTNIEANFEKVNYIRKDSKTFFAKYGYSEETYYLDILKELCEESLDLLSKIQLLTLLEQNCDLLLGSLDEIEQTAGSLLAIYQSAPGLKDPKLSRTLVSCYKAQILTTITSILLARQNESDNQMLFLDLVCQLKDVLLETAISHPWPSLRSTALVCLNEMEAFFPGVLGREQVMDAWQLKQTPAWQCLLALCVENDLRALDHLRRRERLKYYSSVEGLSPPDLEIFNQLVTQAVSSPNRMPPHLLHSLVSSLWAWTVFQPQFPTADLEALLPYLTSSYDFLLLQLALKMADCSPAMMEQLIHLPFLVPRRNRSQQLLCLEWLASHLDQHQNQYNLELLVNLQAFSPFEGPDTHEKKLRILSSIAPANLEPFSSQGVRRMQLILQGLQLLERSSAVAKKTTRPIGSLFRSLAFLLTSFQIPVGELDKLLSGRVLPYVLEPGHPASLRNKLWLHCLDLMHHTLSSPQPPQINKMFLAYLRQLVERGEPHQNPDNFLEVVRTILAHQNFQEFKDELEFLLFQFGTKISCPVAVGRSKLVFTALQRLPPSQLQNHLLRSKPQTPLTEVQPAPKYKSPYAAMTEPIFTIQRHPTRFLVNNEADLPVFQSSTAGEDFLQSYQLFLADIRPGLTLTYQLVAHPTLLERGIEPLFAVVISLEQKPAPTNKIKDFIIPCLQPQKFSGPWEPTFRVCPQNPQPLSLRCRCRFSNPGSVDTAGTIGSDLLPFDSLFLHLPTDQPRKLFAALWELFASGTTPGHLVTTQMLNKPWQTLMPLADSHWGTFLIPAEGETEWRDYGILLACGSHLLLRLKPATEPARATLAIGVDHPATLGGFHSYLTPLLAPTF